jgi:hypothetical protein
MWALAGCQSLCVNLCVRPLASADYTLTITDDPSERRLHVTFTGMSKRQMCLGHDWPSSGSMFTEGGSSTGVYLFVNQRIYAFESTQYRGYCTDLRCYNPVRRGETREGYFSYDGFGLPESEYGATKVLKFKPQPFWCK